jgi:hypothetical protein
MFAHVNEIVANCRMTGMTSGTGPQPEFVILEHAMSDGSILYEHQWRYLEPETTPEDVAASPVEAETDPTDAG